MGALGPLPPSYPTPLSRLIFRDLKLLITLNQEEDEQPSQPGLYKHVNNAVLCILQKACVTLLHPATLVCLTRVLTRD